MKKVMYRSLKKTDYKEVQNLISHAFSLKNYVEDEKMLEKVKKIYLCSCLSEQKFNKVAVYEGKVVGIIMGASKNDKFKLSNASNVFKLMYYTISLWFANKNKDSGYNQVHRAYSELIKGIKDEFDGVLTLFAINEEMRGFGLGKELLSTLNEYYLKHHTNRVYLYTDDTCNYGFYEHMGFSRIREKTVTVRSNDKERELEVYLYGKKL